MNKESQLIDTEEKILKLTTKKSKLSEEDKTPGVVATAKLRFFMMRISTFVVPILSQANHIALNIAKLHILL